MKNIEEVVDEIKEEADETNEVQTAKFATELLRQSKHVILYCSQCGSTQLMTNTDPDSTDYTGQLVDPVICSDCNNN